MDAAAGDSCPSVHLQLHYAILMITDAAAPSAPTVRRILIQNPETWNRSIFSGTSEYFQRLLFGIFRYFFIFFQRHNFVYIVLLNIGIGSVLPWNAFSTSNSVTFSLSTLR